MRVSAVRNRTLVAAAAVASCAVVMVPAARPAEAAPISATILNINDFHGRIDTTNNLTTRWATTIENERLTDPEALLFGAGDLIGATLFTSAVQQDQPTIDVMNEMCLNASAVGNHEFDQGFADLTNRVIGGAAGQATDACPSFAGDQTPGTNALWSYLGANIYQKGTQTPALPEYATFVAHGVTIGVVGVVTSETPALVSPGGITTIDVGDPIEALNRVADQLTDGNIHPVGEATIAIPAVFLTVFEKQLVGSLFGSGNPRVDIPRLLELYTQGQLDLDGLVTNEYSLEGINDGYADMNNGKNIRGVLKFV